MADKSWLIGWVVVDNFVLYVAFHFESGIHKLIDQLFIWTRFVDAKRYFFKTDALELFVAWDNEDDCVVGDVE